MNTGEKMFDACSFERERERGAELALGHAVDYLADARFFHLRGVQLLFEGSRALDRGDFVAAGALLKQVDQMCVRMDASLDQSSAHIRSTGLEV